MLDIFTELLFYQLSEKSIFILNTVTSTYDVIAHSCACGFLGNSLLLLREVCRLDTC